MPQIIFDLLKEINIAQIFAIGVMFWFFYSRLDKKIEKLDVRLTAKIDELDKRLTAKIDDIDKRLCRIEGSLSTQGHCLFSQSSSEKKAG